MIWNFRAIPVVLVCPACGQAKKTKESCKTKNLQIYKHRASFLSYTLSQWPRLIKYLDNGLVRMDNNLLENGIRPFVIGRKNWLFSVTPEGARASATFYSLIETAKANGLEPSKYLRYLFEKFPYSKTSKDVFDLLPMNILKIDLTK